jgi:transcriptional regulator with XRE-family HTH domain
MDNKKIGDFISTLRKNKNFTQKDLADILGVTDKAVSKWERGAGYPDISMLRPLADALDTSVNELLEGKASEHTSDLEEKNISKALDYADQIIASKENKLGQILASILAISLFIAIFVSIIVNIAVNHRLSWSILVIAGCIMGGCLLLPPLVLKKRGLFYSLCLLTLLILPLLGIIQATSLSNSTAPVWFWRIGFPISLTWLAILWFMVLLFHKKKLTLWFYLCIGALLCIPGYMITNYFVDVFLTSIHPSYAEQTAYVSSLVGFLIVASISLVIGLLQRSSKIKAGF